MEHGAKVKEVLKASLTLNFSYRVATHNWVRVMLGQTALNRDWLTNMQL